MTVTTLQVVVEEIVTQVVVEEGDHEDHVAVFLEEKIHTFEVGLLGPQGSAVSPGDAGGLQAFEDDTNPTLGGNLALNAFGMIGQLENTQLIIDGGLL